VFRWPLSNPSSRLPNGSKRGDPLGADEESAGPQSYSQVQNFASQEKAKSAMNHMRWGLASQVTESRPSQQPAPTAARLGERFAPLDPSSLVWCSEIHRI